jgi:hypothetical protein
MDVDCYKLGNEDVHKVQPMFRVVRIALASVNRLCQHIRVSVDLRAKLRRRRTSRCEPRERGNEFTKIS